MAEMGNGIMRVMPPPRWAATPPSIRIRRLCRPLPCRTSPAPPEQPTEPTNPDTPKNPDGPGNPVSPGSPDSPVAPGNPDNPVAPGNPDNPALAGRPDGAVMSGLPQTGQLNWPVPVLAVSGVLLFAAGWVLNKKEALP